MLVHAFRLTRNIFINAEIKPATITSFPGERSSCEQDIKESNAG
jgi:hypothetical protein